MPESNGGDKRMIGHFRRSCGVAGGVVTRPARNVAALVLALLVIPALQAVEVAGVKMEETTEMDGVPAPLVLNGAGVRSKFFVKVYVAGLYLQEKATDAIAVLDSPGPKRVRMHFVYDGISEEKIRAAWTEGYEANHSVAALERFKDRIEKFNSFFPAIKAGDVVDVDYRPGVGTSVIFNGELKGTLPGEDFNRATLKIWLGEEPASSGLKKAMLKGGA